MRNLNEGFYINLNLFQQNINIIRNFSLVFMMARDGKDKETYYKCVKSTETSTHIQSCAETHRPYSVLKVQASCTVRDPAEVNGKSIQGPDEFYDCDGQGIYSLRLPFGLPLKNEQVGCPRCG